MNQGQYLKEVIIEFKAEHKFNILTAEQFLNDVVKAMKVEQTCRHVNNLPPGFDILCGLKESCLYFGYWPENDYVRIIASSCKQFKERKILKLIEYHFAVITNIKMTTNSDESIKEKVKRLWG